MTQNTERNNPGPSAAGPCAACTNRYDRCRGGGTAGWLALNFFPQNIRDWGKEREGVRFILLVVEKWRGNKSSLGSFSSLSPKVVCKAISSSSGLGGNLYFEGNCAMT